MSFAHSLKTTPGTEKRQSSLQGLLCWFHVSSGEGRAGGGDTEEIMCSLVLWPLCRMVLSCFVTHAAPSNAKILIFPAVGILHRDVKPENCFFRCPGARLRK